MLVSEEQTAWVIRADLAGARILDKPHLLNFPLGESSSLGTREFHRKLPESQEKGLFDLGKACMKYIFHGNLGKGFCPEDCSWFKFHSQKDAEGLVRASGCWPTGSTFPSLWFLFNQFLRWQRVALHTVKGTCAESRFPWNLVYHSEASVSFSSLRLLLRSTSVLLSFSSLTPSCQSKGQERSQMSWKVYCMPGAFSLFSQCLCDPHNSRNMEAYPLSCLSYKTYSQSSRLCSFQAKFVLVLEVRHDATLGGSNGERARGAFHSILWCGVLIPVSGFSLWSFLELFKFLQSLYII